jgi:niacin transporter
MHAEPVRSTSARIAAAGFWLAVAVAAPLIFHPIGLGPAFLPMHIPVLVAGAISGPLIGCGVGVLAPWMSHLLTGMPPLAPPIAPMMAVELGVYGLVAGAVRPRVTHRGQPPSQLHAMAREYLWLLPAMLFGRLALGIAAATVGPLLGLKIPAVAYVGGALLAGLPGLAVQALLVPILVARLDRARNAPCIHGIRRAGSR